MYCAEYCLKVADLRCDMLLAALGQGQEGFQAVQTDSARTENHLAWF